VHQTSVHPNTVTNIYGGGSSLAALLYRQWFDYYGVAMPPDPQGAPNGLPVNANFEYYYGSIGSGGGRGSFLAQIPATAVPGVPPIYCPGGVTTCWPYPLWHFSGSDATLSSTEISCYDVGCAGPEDGYSNISAALPVRGQYLQIPTLATSITQAYDPSGQTIQPAGLQLSVNSLCGIWEGTITNWSDPSITTDNGGHVVSTQPITRVVRSDSSGTTFLQTNHLVSACVTTSGHVSAANVWTGGVGGTVTWPNNTGNVIASSGSNGVVASTQSTSGAITYVGPSYVAPVVAGGLPTALVQDYHSLFSSPYKAKYFAPNITNTITAMKNTVIPTNSDPYDIGALNPDPTVAAAYPIAGFTWLEAYQCYNLNSEATGVKSFIKWYAKAGVTGTTPPDEILEAQGLAPLPQNWKTKVRSIAPNVVHGPVAGVCTI
jgi:ABC-type phosphate transport system substrate-binding protein